MNGLNRYGASFMPYTPQAYTPRNFAAPLLPAPMALPQQGGSPLLGLPDVLGGSPEGVSAGEGGFSGFSGFSGFGGPNGGLSPAVSTGLGMAFGVPGMIGAYGLSAIGQSAAANAPAGFSDSSGGAVGAAAGGSGIGPGVGDGGYGADGTGPGTGASEGAGGGGGK